MHLRGSRHTLFALLWVIGCGASHKRPPIAEVPTSAPTVSARTASDDALEKALAERDRIDDQAISAWYDPKLLTADVRPEVLRSLEATTGPLDQLPFYDIDLDVQTAASTFVLTERVYFQNRSTQPLADLMFRMYANTPARGDLPERLARGHCVQTACTVETGGRDTIVVHPAQALAPGARIRIVFRLVGSLAFIDATRTTMKAAAMGSLKSLVGGGSGDGTGDYGLLAEGDDILSFGNFYPVLARRGDGDWDLDATTIGDLGPDALSHVRAHVEVPSGTVVAASGVVTHDEDTGGRRRLDFAAGCMRDFALLASHEFTSAERLEGDVKIRSVFRTTDREMGERVLDVAAWAFRDFQKRFGPYPYRELVMVEQALVGGAGGVEFAGLGTVASMFYKAGGDDTAMKTSVAEFTTAHEVGHQWWHGIVGNDSRKHPWQDEAMAQFSAMLYTEDRYGPDRAKHETDMNVRMAYAVMRMLGHADGPVDAPAGSQSQVVYGGLVYGKGPFYLVALRKALGDAAFFAALQAYAKQYYLGFAPPHALEEIMTHAAGPNGLRIASLSHRWLEETHGDEDVGKGNLGALGGANADLMKMLQQTQ
jgi:hypothetical protein